MRAIFLICEISLCATSHSGIKLPSHLVIHFSNGLFGEGDDCAVAWESQTPFSDAADGNGPCCGLCRGVVLWVTLCWEYFDVLGTLTGQRWTQGQGQKEGHGPDDR